MSALNASLYVGSTRDSPCSTLHFTLRYFLSQEDVNMHLKGLPTVFLSSGGGGGGAKPQTVILLQ